jgi:hypothetical protein
MSFRKPRLALVSLEDRTNPAFALTIADVGASVGITPSVSGSTTTFTASATGATLDVDDLYAAIRTGDVVVSSGTGGGESGEITVSTPLEFVDLELPGNRSLRIRTGSDSTAGNVVFGSDPIDGASRVELIVDTTAPTIDGDIDISGPSSIFEIRSGSFDAGTGTVRFDSIEAVNSITMTGGSIVGTNITDTSRLEVFDLGGSITFNGPYTSTNAENLFVGDTRSSTFHFNGTINGTEEFRFRGTELNLNGNVGLNSAPARLDFDGVNVRHGGNTIVATAITLSDNGSTPGYLGEGTGSIIADLNVQFGGYLAPGGTSIGTMNVSGNISFQNGSGVDVDFGPGDTNDAIIVSIGNVVELSDGNLGGPRGSGAKTGTTPSVIIIAETVTGTFANAPDNTTPVIVSQDVVTAEVTGTTVELSAVAAGLNAATGSDFDGTRYSARLTGPGQLVTIPGEGKPSFVLRNTTAASAFTVTTTANASDRILLAGAVVAAGPLGALNASTTDFTDGISFGSSVRTVKARNLFAPEHRPPLQIGGTATGPTAAVSIGNVEGEIRSRSPLSTLTTKNLFGKVTAPRIVAMKGDRVGAQITASGSLGIGSLTTTRDLTGSVSASVIGAIAVTGRFDADLSAGQLKAMTVYGDTSASINVGSAGAIRVTGGIDPIDNWNMGAGAKSIAAGSIESLEYTGGTLGSLSVTGNEARDIPADLVDSTFNVLGNSGAASGRYGLKTVLVKGNVIDSTFRILDGNVLSFTTGRFLQSRLYLDYTPGVPFNTAGTFDSATAFKLGSFTTSAVALGVPDSPLNFSFSGSEVAADTLGTVRISSLKTTNPGNPHGFKFRTAGGTLRVTKSSDLSTAAIPLNINLTPSVTPIGGGLSTFFYRDV